MLKTAEFFISLVRTSIKASISKRGAFLIESGLMIANNLIFFSIWWIFFRQFNEIAGWQFEDMVTLIAIGTGSYGLMQIFFGGIRNLSKMIVSGDLDPFMTQPKHLLLHIAGSKSFAKGWGHLMTGALIITFGGIATFHTLPLILVSLLSGCLVFTSINIIAHCLPFWMGSVEGLSKKYCDALFLFALYPTNIYSGLLQVVMFTLIPAGVISYLPVELVRHFSWPQLLLLIGSSIVFLSLAVLIFYTGLKRYESGSTFGKPFS
jgi:ABC-2 type transport system permease protein